MKSIIFSTEMVRAILDGRKTVTRRLNGLSYINKEPWAWEYHGKSKESDGIYFEFISLALGDGGNFKAPYQKGDILWVKEPLVEYEEKTFYEADNKPCGVSWQWKRDRLPGMFMPKNLARIWLKVLDVRPERLQEITNEDAIKEGIEQLFKPEDIGKPGINDLGGWKNYLWHGCAKGKLMEEWVWQYSDYSIEKKDGPKLSFSSLWQFLNAKRGYSWEFNPWVCRIEFDEVK